MTSMQVQAQMQAQNSSFACACVRCENQSKHMLKGAHANELPSMATQMHCITSIYVIEIDNYRLSQPNFVMIFLC